MVDVTVWLILVIIIFSVVLVAGLCMLVVVFGHPDDKNTAYFPKFITVFGLYLAFVILLILPYDIAASTTSSAVIRTDILWQIAYITLAVMCIAIIPFAFFFYESDVDESRASELSFFESQTGSAIKYTLAMLVVFFITLGLMYIWLSDAEVPVMGMTQSATDPGLITLVGNGKSIAAFANVVDPNFCYSGKSNEFRCSRQGFLWDIAVSFPLFFITFIAWLGWFFFCTFVGVGFISLPVDYINEFRYRPTPITAREYQDACLQLAERAKTLQETAEKLLEKFENENEPGFFKRRELDRDLHAIENNVFKLKKDYQILYIARQLKGTTVIFYILKLIVGVLGLFISMFWLLHIFIFMLPKNPPTTFLNVFFLDLQNNVPGFPLFSIIFFAMFSFYLLLCVVEGNFRLGVRFLVFKVYPMEVGNTMMNAFLFNTWIILLCALPAVQFCVQAFPYYAHDTTASVIFNQLVRYMKWFNYFFNYNVFIIIIVIFAGLTGIVLSVCPRNRSNEIEKELDKLAKTSSTSLKDVPVIR